MGEGIPVGRIFGISIRIHISWFIIFGVVIWALTTSFPVEWGLAVRITAAIVTSVLFFASVLLHELMHSMVALRNKIPVGAVTLFVFGGVAQVTEEPREPGVEFRVAVAGPLISIILGLVLWGLYFILPIGAEVIRVVVNWLGWTNLVLGVFNLIPAFPMDGGRVLRSIIWWRSRNLRCSTRIASNIGKVIAVLFIVGGIYLFFFTLYGFNGLWLALIGWFLFSAASDSYQQLVLQQALQGHAAREIMASDGIQVQPDMSVEDLISNVMLPSGKHCFIVAEDAYLRGMVTLQEIKGVSGSDRDRYTVGQVMKPVDQLKTVGPDDDLATVMRILTEKNVSQVPVVDHGQLMGMIGRDNLLNFINLKESMAINHK
ncbi:MAG: site-2 protease family protein [Dehalococcoidia bacterium]|nr:site-2 protease family protein [Dehalococcoidia bacterium]